MKRYVRTKDNKIYDIEQQKGTLEVFNGKKFYHAHNIALPLFYFNDIVDENDEIKELIKVGDLVRTKTTSNDYAFSKGTIILNKIANEYELCDLKNNLENGYLELLEIHTKQGSNYIIAWERIKRCYLNMTEEME